MSRMEGYTAGKGGAETQNQLEWRAYRAEHANFINYIMSYQHVVLKKAPRS